MSKENPYNPTVAEMIRRYASSVEMVEPLAAKHLRMIAEDVPHIPDALPKQGACPHCVAIYQVVDYRRPYPYGEEVVISPVRVIKRLCRDDPEFKYGYRAIWRCRNCGEMEIR